MIFYLLRKKSTLKEKKTNNVVSVTPKAHFHSTTYLLSLRNVFTEYDRIVGRIISTSWSQKPVAKGTPQI